MPIVRKKQRQMKPVRVLVFGFAFVILSGTLLLMLPIATKGGQETSFIDAFFTATSATCVTGITLFDTYTHYTVFGQTIIMLMLQVGGIGLLTLVTFFNILIGKKMGLLQAKDTVSDHSLSGFSDFKKVLTRVIVYAFVIEIFGMALLLTVFVPENGMHGVFTALFMSVSAFTNGGFDLFGANGAAHSFVPYLEHPVFPIAIMALIVIGGLGFVVWHNIATLYSTRKLSLHTKVVLLASGILIMTGTAAYFIMHFGEAEFSHMSVGEKIVASLFTSISSRTAGFDGYGFTNSSELSEIITMFLMFIGGAPGSTAGGIKVTTFAILISTIFSVLKGREDIILMNCLVKREIVYKSITVFCLSLFFLLGSFISVYLLNSERHKAIEVMFEVTSAFTTTGFTNGISSEISTASKAIMAFTMFVGRIGPVSLMLSLTLGRRETADKVYPQSTILVG